MRAVVEARDAENVVLRAELAAAQVWDVQISRLVTEWLLPMLKCPCCGQVTTAAAPPRAHAGTIAYGPGVNTAAVLLAAYGNVPAERAAHLIRMLLGMPVSPGFVDKAGCSPASPRSNGRTTSPSAAPRPPNGIRPSPDTGLCT